MTKDPFTKYINAGHNVYLGGGPGTGKTYKVNQMMETTEKVIHLTGTTGCAANHIKGQTIHKFLKTGGINSISDLLMFREQHKFLSSPYIEQDHVLLIEEVSMGSADYINLIDRVLKELFVNENPFGGIQMILVGDACQLPPVLKYLLKDFWFFESKAFKEGNFKIVNLTEVKRQDDKEFITALHEIRFGKCSKKTDDLFKSRQIKPPKGIPVIASKNKEVDRINEKELSEIDSPEIILKAGFEFNENIIRKDQRARLYYNVLKDALVEAEIKLKENCRVMLTSNDLEDAFSNGDMGILVLSYGS